MRQLKRALPKRALDHRSGCADGVLESSETASINADSATPNSSVPNSESGDESDNSTDNGESDDWWFVKVYNYIIDWSVRRSLDSQLRDQNGDYSQSAPLLATVGAFALNFLLIVSKERYESHNPDALGVGKLFENSLDLSTNRLSPSNRDDLLDEEWAFSHSRYLLELLLTSPGFFLFLCIFISCANALIFFSRRRTYQLLHASPVMPLNQGQYQLSSVELRCSKSSSSDLRDDSGFLKIMLHVVLFPAVALLLVPLRFVKATIFREKDLERAKKSDKAFFWQLRMWSPSATSRLLFIWFSPPHVLFTCIAPASWIFMATLHGLLFSAVLSYVTSRYGQLLVDQKLLFEQTMLEYNEKFVYPHQKWSYAASAYNPSISSKRPTSALYRNAYFTRSRTLSHESPTVRASTLNKRD